MDDSQPVVDYPVDDSQPLDDAQPAVNTVTVAPPMEAIQLDSQVSDDEQQPATVDDCLDAKTLILGEASEHDDENLGDQPSHSGSPG